jgi:pimeloyl-ACP methyl ester carboxylesterase/DNA-binding CsgD family transcriptional regulator
MRRSRWPRRCARCCAAKRDNGRVEQRIGHVRLGDGTDVAYAVAGSGPVLVYLPGWVSHLELGWAFPAERRFAEALADGRTLVRYDRPGCGLSGPAPRHSADLAAVEMEILSSIMAAVRSRRVDLLGASLSAPLAVRWAASHPETVNRLVLYGGWVSGRRIVAPGIREHILGLVEQHWGLGSEVLTDIFAPGADATFQTAFAAHQRESASAETARRTLAAGYDLDVTDDLAKVSAPTAVIHRDGDRAVPLAEGRRLAEGIAGSSLTVLEGRGHVPYVGDVDGLVDAIRRGLGLPPLSRRFAPALTRRQLEVAALVSRGLSNRQIAELLVITERSAESHVERIRGRLGFRSRAQIAAWYVVTTA